MVDKRTHDVRIGTSGWNYPLTGYGPWTGVFYPLKQGQKIPAQPEVRRARVTARNASTRSRSTTRSTVRLQ